MTGQSKHSRTDVAAALDQEGYALLESLVRGAELDRLRDEVEAVLAELGDAASDTGTRHAGELPLEAPGLSHALAHPAVRAAVEHVLQRPYRVLHLSARDPLPGFGEQGLHTDWTPQGPDQPARVVTALWLLDDFTPDNGATRVVPGSHRRPGPPPKSVTAPGRRHPEERLVRARAGSVLVFNGHLWHSATKNRSRGRRRVVQCQYVAADSDPREGSAEVS